MKHALFILASLFLATILLLTLVIDRIQSSITQAQPGLPVASAIAPDRTQVMRAPQGGTVMFIENVGQFSDSARFQIRGANGTGIWLANDAVWMILLEPGTDRAQLPEGPGFREVSAESEPRNGVSLKFSFVGGNSNPQIIPFDRLDTKVSFFIGNDPTNWHVDVPVWGGVRYVDLYPGVDLELTGEDGQYRQRLVAYANADLSTVRLRVEGAESMTLDGGRLRLTTAVGKFTLPLLAVEGARPGSRPASFSVEPGTFEVSSPFSSSPPFPHFPFPSHSTSPQDNSGDLLYSTFLGGSNVDSSTAVAVDALGHTYLTGYTTSSDFPTTAGTFDPSFNSNYDGFIVKLNANGTGLVYTTFLGGSGDDCWFGCSIAVDEAGNAYVTGFTGSSDFPTTAGAFDTIYNSGGSDAFVTKLDVAGNALVYSTFLGGSGYDSGHDLMVYNDDVFIVGGAGDGFPTTTSALDTSFNDCGKERWCDVFVARLNANGSALVYSSYLGGSDNDWSNGIAVDSNGRAAIVGPTASDDFPTTSGAFDPDFNGGGRDAFVAKLDATGSSLVFSTYLGGSGSEWGNAVVLDNTDSPIIAGGTESSDMPTSSNAFDSTLGGLRDAFVAKLSGDGKAILYSSFLGGNDRDWCSRGLAVDEGGTIYMAGKTESPDFPSTSGAYDEIYNGGEDAFVVTLNPVCSGLEYATVLGGSNDDYGFDIARYGGGSTYVAGYTGSSDFPTTEGAFDTSHNGQWDIFVAKFADVKYSISGRVQDANGNPFASVTVWAGSGHSAVTNTDGVYSLGNLLAHTYTLTPSQSGYIFWPATRTVTLPPDAGGQNFIILSGPVSTTLTPGTVADLSYNDTQDLLTQLDFPADAVNQITTMVLTPTLASGGGGSAFAGHAFELAAYQGGSLRPDFTFGAPVTLTIHYSDNDVRVVIDESQLALWRWTGSEWQDAAQTCDPVSPYTRDMANNVLSVPACHLSLFSLFGPTNQVYLPLILHQSPWECSR